MKIELTVEGKPLTYEESFWTGKRRLTWCGKELKRVNNRQFVLEPQSEGEEAVEFAVNGNIFKGVTISSAAFSGAVTVRKPLTWVEYVLVILPIIPSVLFGAIGGAIGGLFAAASLYLLPKIKPVWLKIVVGIEMCAVAGLTAFLVAYAFALAILV
ncbi:MAG: hypothetical protein ACI4VK_04270 [Candidatus Coproplasma sp.]